MTRRAEGRVGPESLVQQGVELGLDGAHRQEPPVAGLEGVVEGRAPVEHVGSRWFVVRAERAEHQHPGRQQRHAVDHCDVHHLAPTAPPHRQQTREDAAHCEETAAAGNEVEWGNGPLPGRRMASSTPERAKA
jgi:hypothetical protein